MPAIDFPDVGVTAGSIFTAEGKTWEYNGSSWELVASQERIGTGSIVEEKIANNAVTANKIASGAITSGKIAAGAVLEAALANDSVTSAKIANNAVGTTEIADSSVTAGKLGSLAVTESKINASAITSDKINAAAVTEAKLADGSVTVNKIGDGAVTEAKIGTGVVTNAKLQNSFLTVGSTSISLGSSASVISGLTNLEVSKLLDTNTIRENITITAAAPASPQQISLTNSSVYFFTTGASSNFSFNVKYDDTTTLNSIMSIGEVVTLTALVTVATASTAYCTTITVDGTSSGVTLRWQGGTAPSTGNASSVDAYSFSIVKTANATFSVFGSQTKFA